VTVLQSPQSEIVKLTPKQELFCLLYITYRGNGVRAYSEAYNMPIIDKRSYSSCASAASQNLKKLYIIDKLSELKKKMVVTEEDVIAEHDFLIKQDVDYKAKIAAIRLRRDLEGRTKDSGDTYSQYNIFVQPGQDPKEEAKKYHKWLEQETLVKPEDK